jgi:glycosyltransferase involved in cell wall biosynthesis
VLFVTNMWPHAESPSYGIFVKRQIDSLVDAGLECDVLFVRGYRSPLAYLVAALRLLIANWRGPRYALVHGHGGETAPAVRFYLRAPILVSYCGDDLLGTPGADGTIPWRHRLRRWLLRQQSRLLTATLTKSREMEATLPAPVRARNAVVPNGVDTDLFKPLPRDEARARLGWDPDERVALFAAEPAVLRKRHALARDACDRATEAIGDLRLHVATGTPPGEMPLVMSAADVLLLTSSVEGSPNVVKEAMMCDLPVVTTDVGDVRELLEGVRPSWICAADPAELGEALVDCLRAPGRSNGREASPRLAQDAIARRILSLYARLSPEELASCAE